MRYALLRLATYGPSSTHPNDCSQETFEEVYTGSECGNTVHLEQTQENEYVHYESNKPNRKLERDGVVRERKNG